MDEDCEKQIMGTAPPLQCYRAFQQCVLLLWAMLAIATGFSVFVPHVILAAGNANSVSCICLIPSADSATGTDSGVSLNQTNFILEVYSGLSGELAQEDFANCLGLAFGCLWRRHLLAFVSLESNWGLDFGNQSRKEHYDGTAKIVSLSARYLSEFGFFGQGSIGLASLSTGPIRLTRDTGLYDAVVPGVSPWVPLVGFSIGYSTLLFFVDYQIQFGLSNFHPQPNDNFRFKMFGIRIGFYFDFAKLSEAPKGD